MADMDSPGASNRQAPTTVRRNTAPAKITATRKPLRRTASRRNSGGNRSYSNNQKQNTVRAAERRSQKRSTPSAPPKPEAKVIKPPAPPKPVIPDIAKFLAGDSTYQRQLAAYNKSLSDFQADQGLSRSDYLGNYADTQRDIGLAKTEASGNLEEDYAARGLLKSGLYNTALGELNQQYQNQFNDLDQQKTGFLAQLAQELSKYQNEQSVQKGNAYAEAARRRAERYGL